MKSSIFNLTQLLFILFAISVQSICSARTNINSFENIIIVGDSLSDTYRMGTGFISYCPNPKAGYWNNRFTNGKLWVDYFAEDQGGTFQQKVRNLAVGGASLTEKGAQGLVNPIQKQIELAHSSGYNFSKSLFIIFGGSNDVKDYVDSGRWTSTTSDVLGARIDTAVDSIVTFIKSKGGLEANIVVIGLPALHKIPKASEWTADQREWARRVVTKFWRDTLDGAGSKVVISIHNKIADIVDGAVLHASVVDTTSPCSSVAMCIAQGAPLDGGAYVAKTCSTKMFFDKVHPSSLSHCGMSKWIAEGLNRQFDVAGFQTGDNIYNEIESCGTRRQIPQATWQTWGYTWNVTNTSQAQPIRFRTFANYSSGTLYQHCQFACQLRGASYVNAGIARYPNQSDRQYCECQKN